MVLKSVFIFLFAGVCEISGVYQVWLWIKEDKPLWYGLCGGAVLFLYGAVATMRNAVSPEHMQPMADSLLYCPYCGHGNLTNLSG